MLDNILELVKDQVLPAITGNNEIPADKKDAAVETTTSSILEGLKDQLIPDNLTEVMNMFSGNSPVSNFGNSVMVQGVQSTVSSALTNKVGLNSALATTIASTVVPAVISLFTKKVGDKDEPGFNVESLIAAITGNKGGGSQSGGGILDMLGGLFGGNK
ncbi:hypothetical protein LJC00_04125 [Dysgonomonas sp. OttesenSCG-928-M03]|nr:hypothetical protein [Dysgonomonas sp. OttesenSCG-928-M03]